MKYDIPAALDILKPGAQWMLNGEDYTGITWLSSEQQPTETEVYSKISELDNAEPMRLLRIERDKKIWFTFCFSFFLSSFKLCADPIIIKFFLNLILFIGL